MKNALEKRLAREIKAREEAEKILEEKSIELYEKNKELEYLLDQKKIERLQLFENSVVGVALTNQGIIMEVNETFARFLGYPKEELVGKTVVEVSHPDDVQQSRNQTKSLTDKDIDNFTIRKRYIRKDGTYMWGHTHVNEIQNPEGNTQYHLAVIMDIDNEVKTQKKLENTMSHLREINQNLEKFAYTASHDLKAPLYGINTLINWLEQKNMDEDSQSYLSKLKTRVGLLNNHLNGILNYSQKKSQEDKKEWVDSESLIMDVIKSFKIPAHIKVQFVGDFPKLLVSPERIEQIFQYLIDNAIRYNDKEKGVIKISAQEYNNFIQFTVYDNGKGMNKEVLEGLFEIKNENSTSQLGKGISLPLVKRIIQQLGGDISVRSEENLFTEINFTIAKEKISHSES